MRHSLFAVVSALALASCGSDAPVAPEPEETEIPEELQSTPAAQQPADEAGLGTPMADRVAVIGLLNKRNTASLESRFRS